MKIHHALLLLSVIALVGCETASRMNRVSISMTKRDVVSSVGSPNSTSSPGRGIEFLHYKLNSRGGPIVNLLTDDYVVKLVNGRVVSYGKTDSESDND